MGLRSLTFQHATVETSGGSFTVRGLSPDMVLGIYNRHRGQLSDLFDATMGRVKEGGDQVDVGEVAMSLLADAPGIMAELIALASGSRPTSVTVPDTLPDGSPNDSRYTDWELDVAVARDLPLPVQVDALTKIVDSTFTSDMPAPKFLAVVMKLAGSAAAVNLSRS